MLIWVFGGLLAAERPMAQAVLTVVGSMAVCDSLRTATGVDLRAQLSTALELAFIDYTLLIVSRYRDETRRGQ